MSPLIVRRLWQSVLVLLLITIICFGMLQLAGDPVMMLVAPDASNQEIAAMRQRLGFDQPLAIQYLRFVGRAVQGDFGNSVRYHQPALALVIERLPATVELALFALAVSLTVSLPLGMLAATRRGSLYDQLSMLAALVGQSMPVFMIGLLAILTFAVGLRLFPTTGRGGLEYLVLPGVTLGLYSTARLTRLVRAGLLESLGQDYVRTARSKGLAQRVVIVRHAFRNTLLPIVTVVGLELGSLLGGAVVVETIFAWPGLGLLAVQSIYNRDFPVVLADVVVVGAMIVSINLAVDLIYGVLDPRIRRS